MGKRGTLVHKLYSITELAEDIGVTPRAIRFYEAKGLISPQRAGTTRVYTHRDGARLRLILRGKRLGFSLREIGEWLDLYDVDPAQIEQMRLLLRKTRNRIDTLKRQRDDLDATIAELHEIETQVVDHLKAHDMGGESPPSAENRTTGRAREA
jgi:DNA-binding transcriptional MerR regulator